METDDPAGATPLDPEDEEGLLLPHVSTRGDLDELEEANIQGAVTWALRQIGSGHRRVDVLTEEFLYELHRRMFGSVWKWAGEVRRTDTNIGIDRSLIRVEVRKLIDDARFWRREVVYDVDEIAVRFHHRLVWIHPFPNGNGRHARLMADLIAEQAGRPRFSWGSGALVSTSDLRAAYVAALRQADGGDLAPLLEFARS